MANLLLKIIRSVAWRFKILNGMLKYFIYERIRGDEAFADSKFNHFGKMIYT